MGPTLKLDWYRLDKGLWPPLAAVEPLEIDGKGVYFIWHGGTNPAPVLIGHGRIGIALEHWKRDRRIVSYTRFGPLYCTWARVPKRFRAGVHHYLQFRYRPPCIQRVGETVEQIVANGPWD